jgi:DNA primase
MRSLKYLNTPENTPVSRSANTLYGWHLARGAILRQRSALVVEGYMDLLMLHQHGFRACGRPRWARRSQSSMPQRLPAPGGARFICFTTRTMPVFVRRLRAAEVLQAAGIPTFIVELPAAEDPRQSAAESGC